MLKKIEQYLEKQKKPVSLNRLIKELQLNKKERIKLAGTLRYLEKKGSLRISGDRVLRTPEKLTLRGIFSLNPRGFGFVTPESPDQGSQDIFIPPPYTAGAVTGDLVEVIIKERTTLSKPEGRIIRIIKKARNSLYGLYLEINYQPY
ncbi:MAG: hypothetical protein ACPLRA_01545, partial [Candidatus Saccharicenans sp.]